MAQRIRSFIFPPVTDFLFHQKIIFRHFVFLIFLLYTYCQLVTPYKYPCIISPLPSLYSLHCVCFRTHSFRGSASNEKFQESSPYFPSSQQPSYSEVTLHSSHVFLSLASRTIYRSMIGYFRKQSSVSFVKGLQNYKAHPLSPPTRYCIPRSSKMDVTESAPILQFKCP